MYLIISIYSIYIIIYRIEPYGSTTRSRSIHKIRYYMLLLLRDSTADITSDDTIEGYPTGEGLTFEISNHLFSKLIYDLKQCGLHQRRQKR